MKTNLLFLAVVLFLSSCYRDPKACKEIATFETLDLFEVERLGAFELDASIEDKVAAIATKIYGADGVDFAPKAKLALRRIDRLGLNHLPVCMAKTQKSLSDNDKLLGRPSGFTLTVREIEIAAGAEFIIPITGSIMRMPGLPMKPAAEGMDIDSDGNISGLF